MKFEHVVIFGLGAVGSNVLLNLIRDLPDLLYTAVDYDKVEERNYRVGTQPYLRQHLGKYKTQSMQMICQMQANKRIQIVNSKIENEKDINTIIQGIPNSLMIDAFDKAQYRNLFSKYIKPSVVHIGFSPLRTGSIIWDNMWTNITDTKTDVDICTMQGARSFIMSLTSIASMSILDFYYEDKKTNLFFNSGYNLKELK